ncbi:hypothetical protein AB0M32_16405 [Streptomyces sp. NPDC051985]
MFRYLAPVFAVGLVLTFLLPEKRLTDGNGPPPKSASGTEVAALVSD